MLFESAAVDDSAAIAGTAQIQSPRATIIPLLMLHTTPSFDGTIKIAV
jgi:hypothetical protein